MMLYIKRKRKRKRTAIKEVWALRLVFYSCLCSWFIVFRNQIYFVCARCEFKARDKCTSTTVSVAHSEFGVIHNFNE